MRLGLSARSMSAMGYSIFDGVPLELLKNAQRARDLPMTVYSILSIEAPGQFYLLDNIAPVGPHMRMREKPRFGMTLSPATASLGWWWRSHERWRVRG